MATEAEGRGGPAPNVSPPASRSAVDLATIVGIPGAFLLIFTTIFLGGSPGAFINLPSIFIVLGGTFGVTTACFSLNDMSTPFGLSHRPYFIARGIREAPPSMCCNWHRSYATGVHWPYRPISTISNRKGCSIEA